MRHLFTKTLCASLLGISACAMVSTSALAKTELTILGTKGGPSILQVDRLPQSSVIQDDDKAYLIDAGYGASYRMVQAGVPLRDLQAVFITHLHSDHVVDYPAVLMNSWASGLKHDIDVFGPVGTKAMTDGVYKTFSRDLDLRVADEGKPVLQDMVHVTDLNSKAATSVYKKDNIAVESLVVPHPPFNDGEAFAYKIEINGKTAVFTGDMTYNDQIIDFAKDADYFISEAVLVKGVEALAARIGNGSTLAEAIISHHTTATDVGKIAQAANVKNLVVTHMVPADDPEITDNDWIKDFSKHYKGNIIIAKDLLKISLD